MCAFALSKRDLSPPSIEPLAGVWSAHSMFFGFLSKIDEEEVHYQTMGLLQCLEFVVSHEDPGVNRPPYMTKIPVTRLCMKKKPVTGKRCSISH